MVRDATTNGDLRCMRSSRFFQWRPDQVIHKPLGRGIHLGREFNDEAWPPDSKVVCCFNGFKQSDKRPRRARGSLYQNVDMSLVPC